MRRIKNSVKKAVRPSSFFEKTDSRNINNLFTGYDLSKKGKATATIGVVAYGASNFIDLDGNSNLVDLGGRINKVQNEQAMESQKGEGLQAVPGTYGDGQEYMSRMRDMQSQSDLVFAMNKLRNGRV